MVDSEVVDWLLVGWKGVGLGGMTGRGGGRGQGWPHGRGEGLLVQVAPHPENL